MYWALFAIAVSISAGGTTSSFVQPWLKTADGLTWLKQRLFYRSCNAFYRSFQLWLAYLILERKYFQTWGRVTGYYSRFFFIQAFLNLLMATWAELDKHFIFFDGKGKKVQCLPQKSLSQLFVLVLWGRIQRTPVV